MPTRNNVSSNSLKSDLSKSLRSEVGGTSTALKYPEDYTKNMWLSKKEIGEKANDMFYAPSPIVASRIKKAVDAINEGIVPQSQTLNELYNENNYSYRRYMAVNAQTHFTKSVEDNIKDLQGEMDKVTTKTNYLGNARDIVRNLANNFLEESFLKGKKDFSMASVHFYQTQAQKYGTQVAGELIRFGLIEGFDRMKRAGMSYKDDKYIKGEGLGG